MKTIFFKVVQPMNECLHLLLCSFMRSWITNTNWRVFNSVCCGHNWDLYYLAFRKNRSQYYLFSCWILGKSVFPLISLKNLPPLYVFPPFIWEGKGYQSSFLSNDDFYQSLLLLFCDDFYLSSVVLSLPWDGLLYF